LILIVMWL